MAARPTPPTTRTKRRPPPRARPRTEPRVAQPTTPGTDTEATQGDRTSSRLVSATAIMAAGTALSRILGFVRVALLAAALGATTHQANMFTYATVIPQAIYMLLAGGVLNTVFVPQIVRAMQEDAD